jgi:tetratricopeptide (TPR) repeat protein
MKGQNLFAVLVLGLATPGLGSSVARAKQSSSSSWKQKVQEYQRQGHYKKAYRMQLARTAKGALSSDRIMRAELLEKLGHLHLALIERILAAKQGKSGDRELASIGNLALVVDRLEPVANLALSLQRRGDRSWPASFRGALAAYFFRIGNLRRAQEFLPTPAQIQSLPAAARYKASLLASAVALASNRLNIASALLSSPPDRDTGLDAGLFHLQRSRIFYDQGRLTDALEELILLPRTSPSWYPGLLVGAWSAYRVGDYNLALGELMSIHSPFLAKRYNPESYILEAATLFQLCHYESALRSLEKFKEKYSPLVQTMDRFKRQYGTRYTAVSTILNYARGETETTSGTPEQDSYTVMMDGLLQEEPLTDVDRSLGEAESEEHFLSGLDSGDAWVHANVGLYRREIDAAKREAYRKGLRIVLRRLSEMRKEVSDATESALAIEVEINTRIRERLVTGQLPKFKEVDFKTEINKGYEFWPFQGEFWRDEAGSYVFATTDVCGGEGAGT